MWRTRIRDQKFINGVLTNYATCYYLKSREFNLHRTLKVIERRLEMGIIRNCNFIDVDTRG